MQYTFAQHAWMNQVAAGDPLDDKRRRALICAADYVAQQGHIARSLDYHQLREGLRWAMPDLYKASLREDGYGFVIAIWILIAIAVAAIEWAVGRLLDWLFPESLQTIDPSRVSRLASLSVERAPDE